MTIFEQKIYRDKINLTNIESSTLTHHSIGRFKSHVDVGDPSGVDI